MYRFNPAPPEGRTATSTAPRSHSPTHLDSTYSTANLTAPPNLLVIYRPIPLSLMNAESTSNANQTTPNPAQRRILISITNGNRPKGLNGPHHGEEQQTTLRSLEPDGMNGMDFFFLSFDIQSLFRTCNLTINCSYTTIMLG